MKKLMSLGRISPFIYRKLRSLKVSLIIPFVLLVGLVAIVLSASYYWSARKNTHEFLNRYITQTTKRIDQAVHNRLDASESVLNVAFPHGVWVDDDISGHIQDLRTRFWAATSVNRGINNYVYYSNKAGQDFALKRLRQNQAEMRIKLKAGQRRIYYQYRGVLGYPKAVWQEKRVFNPHDRVWYFLAERRGRSVWTPVYIDFTSNSLVITRTRPVYNQKNQFEGVVATDVSLESISRFLSTLDIGKEGRTFIVEPTGDLIAAAHVASAGVGIRGRMQRVNADHISDPVVRTAFRNVIHHFDLKTDVLRDHDKPHPVYLTTVKGVDNDNISVGATRIVDNSGLNWMVVVAMPHKQILAEAKRQAWVALGIGLLAIFLTIGSGMLIFGRIGDDIKALSDAVARIRRGDLDVKVEVTRHDEIGVLARNFKAMHTELYTDKLTGVANRTALNSFLDDITHRVSRLPFTLFFIDFNHFKPLNDRYGHDNGDRALIEVSHRFLDVLRSEDFIARLGGDEFVVIVPGTVLTKEIQRIISKLTVAVETPLQTLEDVPADEVVSLGAAIGYACWPEDAPDKDALLKKADKAMYKSKDGRR